MFELTNNFIVNIEPSFIDYKIVMNFEAVFH